jgi:hypothetical protein
MHNGAVFLSDGEMYDIIVDVVGDETSLEFCALSDYYLEDESLDAAMKMNGVLWDDMEPLIDEVEEKAKALREEKGETEGGEDGE